MIKSAIKENYGTPLLRGLIRDAYSLGIRMSFYNDMEGKYVVIFNSAEYVFPKKAGAAGACWFVRGIVDMAKTQMINRVKVG